MTRSTKMLVVMDFLFLYILELFIIGRPSASNPSSSTTCSFKNFSGDSSLSIFPVFKTNVIFMI